MRDPRFIQVPARSALYVVLGGAVLWINDHGPHNPVVTWALLLGLAAWLIWTLCTGEGCPPPPKPRERERGRPPSSAHQ